MSTAQLTPPPVDHDHGHDHPEWLAHHFETPAQQTEAGKLGIWLFLAQEVLFFAGLFAAYSVYRFNHPEVFLDAHKYLNPTLGAANTIVLLASSLAVAWGVRAAQLDKQKVLLWTHIFTLSCAGIFLGVKAVEYMYKFYEGLYWASSYAPGAEPPVATINSNLNWIVIWCGAIGLLTMAFGWKQKSGERPGRGWISFSVGVVIASVALGVVGANWIQANTASHHGPAHGEEHGAAGDHGAAVQGATHHESAAAEGDHAAAEDHSAETEASPRPETAPAAATEPAPAMAPAAAVPAATPSLSTLPGGVGGGNFFSIYFAMTGVHAIHIIGGIIAILWIVGRIGKGDFGPSYYDPVEFVGLYWHLVDLVWIYLFPLLYLIH